MLGSGYQSSVAVEALTNLSVQLVFEVTFRGKKWIAKEYTCSYLISKARSY